MTLHEIFLEWVILANEGHRRAAFPLLDDRDLALLRGYKSSWIKKAKIYTKNGKTVIELI